MHYVINANTTGAGWWVLGQAYPVSITVLVWPGVHI